MAHMKLLALVLWPWCCGVSFRELLDTSLGFSGPLVTNIWLRVRYPVYVFADDSACVSAASYSASWSLLDSRVRGPELPLYNKLLLFLLLLWIPFLPSNFILSYKQIKTYPIFKIDLLTAYHFPLLLLFMVLIELVYSIHSANSAS